MEPDFRSLACVNEDPAMNRTSIAAALRRWVDPFLVMLVVVMVGALALPLGSGLIAGFAIASKVSIVVLFLVYGMRLPTPEILAGLRNVRLQGAIVASTYLVFPALGILAFHLSTPLIGHELAQGLLFLSLLPSTVQSSVAFTSIARGNVPGAICGATLSNTLGIVLTPALVLIFMDVGSAKADGSAVLTILGMLLAPFIAGQLLQRWTGPWLREHPWLTQATDRGTILIVVFAAVAAASNDGTWVGVTLGTILALTVISGVLLAIMLAITWWGGRALGLPLADRIALLMCGSKKSLATGLPMSIVLFPAALAASLALPLIIFHQVQLMVCAVLARHLAYRAPLDGVVETVPEIPPSG